MLAYDRPIYTCWVIMRLKANKMYLLLGKKQFAGGGRKTSNHAALAKTISGLQKWAASPVKSDVPARVYMQ